MITLQPEEDMPYRIWSLINITLAPECFINCNEYLMQTQIRLIFAANCSVGIHRGTGSEEAGEARCAVGKRCTRSLVRGPPRSYRTLRVLPPTRSLLHLHLVPDLAGSKNVNRQASTKTQRS